MKKNGLLYIAILFAFVMTMLVAPPPIMFETQGDDPGEIKTMPTPSQMQDTPTPLPTPSPTPAPTPEPTPTPTPTPPPPPDPWELFDPHFISETDPESIRFQHDIRAGGETVSEYNNAEQIFFSLPDIYTSIEGVTTFRGNNFRSAPTYGTADITQGKLTELYRVGTGGLQTSLSFWTGVGWPGQPAIVKWDFDTLQQMNILPEKKEKEGLVEVIQGAMDGYIYFFDLEDGKPTRNRMNIGEPIKGGVTVDPRGYPLLYVGQGDVAGGRFGYYIFSLIDFSELYFINGRDSFAHRTWAAFDSNPLFDAQNDRMFLCGENGVIYNVKLNTNYNNDGEISVDPQIVRYRYRNSINRQMGIESSPSIFSHYMFISDNNGVVQCIDLMTFTPIWIRDCTDDTDSTIVLEWEEDTQMLALYTGSKVDTRGQGTSGTAYIRKLNAENGELLWEYSYPCYAEPGLAGGNLATPILGKENMSDLVVFWVGKLRGMNAGGALVALDKHSGEVIWEKLLPNYGWSSPIDIYTDDGRGYVVVCDSVGRMYLVRGSTGDILDTINLGSNVEASPAAFGNTIIVGTRGQRIYGIRVS